MLKCYPINATNLIHGHVSLLTRNVLDYSLFSYNQLGFLTEPMINDINISQIQTYDFLQAVSIILLNRVNTLNARINTYIIHCTNKGNKIRKCETKIMVCY